MKHFIRLQVLVLFTLAIFRCKSPNTSPIVNIQPDNISESVDLKLSDLADSFKIISLETRDDCMLNDITEYYMFKDYIIAWNENGAYKFSTKGRFIKKLFAPGRGPNEIADLLFCIFTIDENRNILYIDDQMHRETYFRFDLKSEKFIDPVKKCFPSFGFFDIKNDSIIIVSDISNPEYSSYCQNLKGDFISGIVNKKKMLSSKKEILQPGRLIKSGSNYFYSFRCDDTLFKIVDTKLIPYLALNFKVSRGSPQKERLENGDIRLIIFQPCTPSYFIILILYDNFKKFDLNNRGIGKGKSFYLLLNNLNGKTLKINSYTDNFIGETKDALALSNIDILSPFFIKLSSNKKIIIPYWPGQIKKTIKKGLNYKDFPVEINDQLLGIDKSLHETDNPILLVGNLKDR